MRTMTRQAIVLRSVLSPAGLFECIPASDAKRLEDHGSGAKSGEGGLEHVEAGKGCQQEPVGRYPVTQREADRDHQSGKCEYGAIEIHICFP